MQIHGLQQSQTLQSVNSSAQPKPAEVSQSVDSMSAPADQLDLSPEALALSQAGAAEASTIRMDKVASIRQAIADGTYETPEKMSAALDKMLDTFA